ncbi:MAG TPA: glycoside hydrolase family 16 protein [Spirochaetota bacterium]|nr:glycoside hydrolase family 16 protein [Spirochaetota bacterium]
MRKSTAIFCFKIHIILLIAAAALSCSGISPKETFRDDFDGETVDASLWQVAGWYEHGGQTSPERCYVRDGYLNMVFINDSGTFLSAAIQTHGRFLYGRWEARLKPSPVYGVLNSLYTIDWDDPSTAGASDDGTKQEIDIEFLTKSFTETGGEVHFAVHEEGGTSFNLNPDLEIGFNLSDDFHVWAIEILPDRINWYVDGRLLHSYEYSAGGIAIDSPYQLKLNVWSQDGAATWIGGPPADGVECIYQIDWIRFISYE